MGTMAIPQTATEAMGTATIPRPRLDAGILALQEKVVRMGTTTEQMVRDAMDAVLTLRDTEFRANEIAERDNIVDELDQQVEWEALRLLALQQPVMAYDLRYVGSAMKVVTDLERIGDHAVNIAKVAHRIRYAGITYEPLVDFPRFRDIVCRMLSEVTVAFANRDTSAAEAVIALDDEADVFYKEAVRELRLSMTDGHVSSGRILLCSHLLFVAHYLERIGDHSCNIAERILFMEKGKRPPRSAERARPMQQPV